MKQIIVGLAASLLGWGLTGLVLVAVRNAQHFAPPTERGLHKIPTPIGGGLGLIGATLLMWLLTSGPATSVMTIIAGAVLALAGLSWIDDLKPLPPALRFAAQAAVIAAMLYFLPHDKRLLPMVPELLERCALGFGWLWVLNLTNFMDGIDGLAGVGAVTMGIGYTALVLSYPVDAHIVPSLPNLALILAAAAVGYLYWNWAPARIFMGDVGSIPLGFLIGLLMFDLMRHGRVAAALILPMYFIFDATSTLLERLMRGAKPWQPHREHAYQRAVLGGMTHAQVTLHVAVLGVALVALAVLSVRWPWPSLIAATVMTTGLILWLRHNGSTPTTSLT